MKRGHIDRQKENRQKDKYIDGHRDSMKELAKGRLFEKLDGVGPFDNRPSPE